MNWTKEVIVLYRGRVFSVRADHDEEAQAYTESIAEELPDGTIAHWDGSGVYHGLMNGAFGDAITSIITTVDDDEDLTR